MSEKILICLPTYHRPDSLVRAVESVRWQTHNDFECWIVKDGCREAACLHPYSTQRACLECGQCEQTRKLAQHIIAKDCRFRYFALPINMQGGGWGGRNFCILNSEIDLIAYLDDDNWWEPNHLELLYKTLTEKNVQFAYTGTNVFRGGAKAWVRLDLGPPRFAAIDTSEIMHRRGLIGKYGGWRADPTTTENHTFPNDWDLVERWMKNDEPWAHTGEVT